MCMCMRKSWFGDETSESSIHEVVLTFGAWLPNLMEDEEKRWPNILAGG